MLCITLEYSLSRIFATVVPVRSNSDPGAYGQLQIFAGGDAAFRFGLRRGAGTMAGGDARGKGALPDIGFGDARRNQTRQAS
jgi:hypothetical protein